MQGNDGQLKSLRYLKDKGLIIVCRSLQNSSVLAAEITPPLVLGVLMLLNAASSQFGITNNNE